MMTRNNKSCHKNGQFVETQHIYHYMSPLSQKVYKVLCVYIGWFVFLPRVHYYFPWHGLLKAPTSFESESPSLGPGWWAEDLNLS